MNDAERIYFATWHARCIMRRHVAVESCIMATKLMGHLLPDLVPGIRTMPVAVGAVAMNQRALDRVLAGESTDDDDESMVLSCSFRGGTNGRWWQAHLIMAAWTEEGTWLIDPSADQFSMPDKNLIVEPSVMALPEGLNLSDWLDSNDALSYALKDGGSISYEPHTEDTSYQPTMDWIETYPGEKGYDYVAERVTALMDLYGDLDHITPAQLPKLPDGVSMKFSDPQVLLAWERRAFLEIGYTEEEMLERIERDQRRELIASAERVAESMKLTGQAARKMGATLRRARMLGRSPGSRP